MAGVKHISLGMSARAPSPTLETPCDTHTFLYTTPTIVLQNGRRQAHQSWHAGTRPLPLLPLAWMAGDGLVLPAAPVTGGTGGGEARLHPPASTRLIVFRQAEDGAGRRGGGRRVGGHARAREALEEPLDLGRTAREALGPEVVARVFDELDEGDEQAPRVGRR